MSDPQTSGTVGSATGLGNSSSTGRPAASGTQIWMLLIALAIILVLGIHLTGRVGAYCSPKQYDSYIYTSFGYRMAHGEVLYRDMSDIKPPGLFCLYALVYLVSPAARWSVAPLESLFLILAYYLMYRAGAQIYNRSIGLVVAVVGALTINYFSVTGHTIEGFGLAENFMVLPAVGAAFFYFRAMCRPSTTVLFITGMMLGLDLSIKQTALPLVATIAVHWTVLTLVVDRSIRRWAVGCGWLLLGASAAGAPFVMLLLFQGTLGDAWHLLTDNAVEMLTRGSAWPVDWRDVLPLWIPAAWWAWAFPAWLERRSRSETSNKAIGATQRSTRYMTMVLLWCALELLLLHHLPLRSAHYYVATCVPFVLLSGWPWMVLAKSLPGLSRGVQVASWSMAVIGAAICYRPVVDVIVPKAVANYRTYDWSADQRYFDEAIQWGRVHFGEGPPWVRQAED